MGGVHYMKKFRFKKRYSKTPSYLTADQLGTRFATVGSIALTWSHKNKGVSISTISARLNRGVKNRALPNTLVIKDGCDPKKWPLVIDVELALKFLDDVHEIIEQEKLKEAASPQTPTEQAIQARLAKRTRRRHINDLYRQQQACVAKLDKMEKAMGRILGAVEQLGRILVRDFQLDVPDSSAAELSLAVPLQSQVANDLDLAWREESFD
jgi:hypothetical protein